MAALRADAASKFAVKGFTEALHVEFSTHAPHIHAAVVMPGASCAAVVRLSDLQLISLAMLDGRARGDLDRDQIRGRG